MDKPAIPMQPVESTSLRAYGYDAGSQTLAVEFKNGRSYNFPNISQEQADGLAKAKSAGGYVNQLIRGEATARPAAEAATRQSRSPIRRRAGR